jgi:hypothetical protein
MGGDRKRWLEILEICNALVKAKPIVPWTMGPCAPIRDQCLELRFWIPIHPNLADAVSRVGPEGTMSRMLSVPSNSKRRRGSGAKRHREIFTE